VPELALTRSLTAALCGLVVLPASALAADGEGTKLDLGGAADTAAQHTANSGSGAMLVRTVVGLAVVIGVIYGITWVMRQVRSAREDRATGQSLDTVATLPLGPGKALHLVRAGSEHVLVGTSEHGVTPIRRYSEEEARTLGLVGEDAVPPTDGGLLDAPARRKGWLDELRARTVIK
jgi:flagellar protein FliO/FliZ